MMNKKHCPQCGLVNFASEKECKRCKTLLDSSPVLPDVQSASPIQAMPAMPGNLYSCPACGYGVAHSASHCLQCGGKVYSPRASQRNVILLLCILGIFSLCGVFTFISASRKSYDTPASSKLNSPSTTLKYMGPFHHNGNITSQFDKFEKYTAISLEKMPISGGNSERLELSAFFIKSETSNTPPNSVILRFLSMSDDWRYLKYHDVSILADNRPLSFSPSEHDGSVGSGYVLEFIDVALPYQTFVQMVNAGKVEMRVGGTELNVTQNHLDALRDLAHHTIE